MKKSLLLPAVLSLSLLTGCVNESDSVQEGAPKGITKKLTSENSVKINEIVEIPQDEFFKKLDSLKDELGQHVFIPEDGIYKVENSSKVIVLIGQVHESIDLNGNHRKHVGPIAKILEENQASIQKALKIFGEANMIDNVILEGQNDLNKPLNYTDFTSASKGSFNAAVKIEKEAPDLFEVYGAEQDVNMYKLTIFNQLLKQAPGIISSYRNSSGIIQNKIVQNVKDVALSGLANNESFSSDKMNMAIEELFYTDFSNYHLASDLNNYLTYKSRNRHAVDISNDVSGNSAIIFGLSHLEDGPALFEKTNNVSFGVNGSKQTIEQELKSRGISYIKVIPKISAIK